MIVLDGSSLTIEQLIAIADERERVQLSSEARARVSRSRAVVERRARGSEPAYGINTGFGSYESVGFHERAGQPDAAVGSGRRDCVERDELQKHGLK